MILVKSKIYKTLRCKGPRGRGDLRTGKFSKAVIMDRRNDL